jgi:hypothetical protein
MSDRIHAPSRKLHVLLAVAVVVLLGSSLGFRLAANPDRGAGDGLATPRATRDHATVPAPKPFHMADLTIPHWSHQNAREWPVEFKTDLDLLAPLGNGAHNAGAWYVDFRKPDGPRYEEARAMMERRKDREEPFANVLPPNDPLLLEAEPWCDQATMSFYPEFLEPDGWYTQVPNLLVPLTFARSWVARGVESRDPETGMDDCRRAIRLGRLLRQEDTVIISDLVGLACIRMGAQGIYDIAVREGDAELALLASIVIGEVAPQRLLTSERITRSEVSGFLRENELGKTVLEIPDARLETTLEMARNQPDRRFRAEAILQLNFVRWLGTEAQQQRVIELLTELRDLDDPVLSETARWSLETKPTPEQIEEMK